MPHPVSHDVFRERVNQLLARSGLTYAAFARQAKLDRSTLSQLLTGSMPRLPRAETLAMIARTANVSVDWLLGLSQREEVGSELIEAVMKVEPYGNTPANDTFLGWLRSAQGLRICSVPVGVPDLFKSEDVLRHEYRAAFENAGLSPIEAVQRRLAMLRQPHQQLELATSRDSFLHFARGIGLWSSVPASLRRAQFQRMIDLADEFYPSLRIYLYDAASSYSVPFTVFGDQRVAMFLGTSYLVLNSAAHIQLFLNRFDDLVRVASIQPHQFSGYVRELIDQVE
ncbi:MAG: helix-turn-helix domain-containing protein [Beijerinckiaceae bacterium]|nr:helix-turn-helix domain-containing protein [Beijerinckiaceae bacterium]